MTSTANLLAAKAATETSIIITKISVTSNATSNYETLTDNTSGYSLTQATIISEPYFDTQTPKNVTGLVGKSISWKMLLILSFFSRRFLSYP